MNTRGEKIKKALIKEISQIIQQRIKDPRIEGIISVTDVDLSVDYRYAKVYISIYGSEKQKETVMEAIEESASFIRKEVGKRIRLRHTPELKFCLDETFEKGKKLTDLIDKISKGEL